MFIDNETKLRVDIYREYKGFSRLGTPEIRATANVVEIPDPMPPEDFSDDTYFKTEQAEAPYVICTKRPQEQIDAAEDSRLVQRMAALESNSMRAVREAVLTGDNIRLQAIEDKIVALRQKMKRQGVQQ